MAKTLFKIVFRYLLRVALYLLFLCGVIYFCVRFVLPALLPDIINRVEDELHRLYGLTIQIEDTEIHWNEQLAPVITTDQFVLSGIQNVQYLAKDVTIDVSSVYDFLKGEPIAVDVFAKNIELSPDITPEEAADTFNVPFLRNPYDQISGVAKYFNRLVVRTERISVEDRSETLDAAAVYVRLGEKLEFQFNADPSQAVINGLNITGWIDHQEQSLSIDVSPAEITADWLELVGLQPFEAFHLNLASKNFYNNKPPEVVGKLFQGGEKFASLVLENDKWSLTQKDSGLLASGRYILGPSFGWLLTGQMYAEPILGYAKALPAITDFLQSYEATGSVDFIVSGASPLIPSNNLGITFNDVSVLSDDWEVEGITGAVDSAFGIENKRFNFVVDRFNWGDEDSVSSGTLVDIDATGEVAIEEQRLQIFNLASKLGNDQQITADWVYQHVPRQLTMTVSSEALAVGEISSMLPLKKGSKFTRWFKYALPHVMLKDLSMFYSGDLTSFKENPNQQLKVTADAKASEMLFNEKWPVVKNLRSKIALDNDVLGLMELSGHYKDLQFEADEAEIFNMFSTPEMTVAGNLVGSAKQYLQFLTASPLKDLVATPLAKIKPRGEIQSYLNLQFPLRKNMGIKPVVAGEFSFDDGQITLESESGELIKHAQGMVSYKNNIVSGNAIKAELREGQAVIDFTFTPANPKAGLQASLKGEFDNRALLKGTGLEQYITGKEYWEIDLLDKGDLGSDITLTSRLRKSKLNLPNGIQANKKQKLVIDVKSDGQNAIAKVNYPSVVTGVFTLKQGKGSVYSLTGGTLDIGGQKIPMLTDQNTIVLNGDIPELDLESLLSGEQGLPIERGRLSIQRIFYGDYELLGAADLDFDITADKMDIQISGEGIEGFISKTKQGFWFDLIKLSILDKSVNRKNLKSANFDSDMVMLPPNIIPTIKANVLHFSRNGKRLGAIKFTGKNNDDRYDINNFQLNTGNGWVQGTGVLTDLKPFTYAQLKIQAHGVGNIVKTFTGTKNMSIRQLFIDGNFYLNQQKSKGLVQSARTKATGKDGAFYDINPGVANLLKVINPIWIVKTLNGNGNGNGFTFNSFNGELSMNQDTMYINGVEIDSDIAQMYVHGTLGRASERLNLGIGILPKFQGAGLIAGAFFGGPIGAAIGLGIGEVLGVEATRPSDILKITGTINNPKREIIF